MKIAEKVYQVSGHPYGMNSSVFALDDPDGVILIDAGNTEKQYLQIMDALSSWGLSGRPVKAVLVTHAHMDHIGGAHYFEEAGAQICIGEEEAAAAVEGGPSVLEELFGSTFVPCRKVTPLKDGDVLSFSEWRVRVIAAPGHTKGTAAYLAENRGKKILFSGDMTVLKEISPADEMVFEPGWNGSPDYNEEKEQQSFRKLSGIEADILAPGHGCVYYGPAGPVFAGLCK